MAALIILAEAFRLPLLQASLATGPCFIVPECCQVAPVLWLLVWEPEVCQSVDLQGPRVTPAQRPAGHLHVAEQPELPSWAIFGCP